MFQVHTLLETSKHIRLIKKYDLIMMLFSLLHLPREKHEEILKNIYNHLNDKGVFILTL